MNSRIILCKNIKLDKDYRNVINYSEQQMLVLCNDNKINESLSYSFIRDNKNSISVNFTYNECLQANYIAFQNPNYSNKWFFAFIDSVVYNTDASTQINFIVDVWSTWFSKVNVSECFVIRENVNDDTVGLHTLPENVETGEYIVNQYNKYEPLTNFYYIVQVSELSPAPVLRPSPEPDVPVTNMGDIPLQGFCYLCNNPKAMAFVVASYQEGKTEAIIGTYMIPIALIGDLGTPLYEEDDVEIYMFTKYSAGYLDYSVSKPSTIDGYTPKNKKLLTAPYNVLVLDNNNGVSNILFYEMFSDSNATFKITGVPTQGCSIKCIPSNYKGASMNEQEGIIGGKLPTLGWVSDPYTNWLSQNAINLGVGIVSDVFSFVSGLAMASTGAISSISTASNVGAGIEKQGTNSMIGSVFSILDTIGTVYKHEMQPLTACGNVNAGDITTVQKANTFYFINKCIRKEYAQIIDDYFTRFGYKVNRLKVPNITGRPIFNYIQISSTDDIGFGEVPNAFMEAINQIARRGTTIWHNHANIGNYTLDNSI